MEDKKNIFDDIAFWILASTTFLLPVFFLPASWSSLIQAKMDLFGLGVIAALIFFGIGRLSQGSVSLKLKAVYVPFVLLPIVYFVSSLLSLSAHRSFIGGGFDMDTLHGVSLCLIYCLLISILVKTPKRIRTVIFGFIFSIFVTGILQLIRIFAGDVFSFGLLASPAVTLAGKWNDLVCLFVLFLGALLIFLETTRLKKWISYALLVLVVVPFFFISLSSLAFDFYFWACSLSMLVGVIALLVFAYIFSIRRSKGKALEGQALASKDKSALPVPSLVVLMLSLVLVLFARPIGSFLASQTQVIYADAPLTWQATYNVASKILPQDAFFGSGPNTFSYGWNLVKPQAVNNYFFWNSDIPYGVGLVPTSLITVGILGFGLWVAFYILIIGMAIRNLFSHKSAIALGTKTIISFAVLFTSFIVIFYSAGPVVVFAHFLFIGLLLAIDPSSKKDLVFQFNASQWRHFTVTFFAVIFMLGAFFWGWRIVAKAVAVAKTNSVISMSKDASEALTKMADVISLDPQSPVYYQIVSQIYLSKVSQISSLSQSQLAEKKSEIQSDVSNAASSALFAESLDPIDFKARITTARMYDFLGSVGVPGAFKEAIAKYTSASELSPTNPLPYVLAANTYVSLSDFTSAKDSLVHAITLKPDWSDAPDIAKAIQSLILTINKSSASPIEPVAEATSTKDSVKPKSSK